MLVGSVLAENSIWVGRICLAHGDESARCRFAWTEWVVLEGLVVEDGVALSIFLVAQSYSDRISCQEVGQRGKRRKSVHETRWTLLPEL